MTTPFQPDPGAVVPEPSSGLPKLTKDQWDQLGYSPEEYKRNHPDNAAPAKEHGVNEIAPPPVVEGG